MRILLASVVVGAFAIIPAFCAAQDEMRTETVRFSAGSTNSTIQDVVTGREFVVYEIGAEAGHRLQIQLTANIPATYFNVYEPGRGPGGEALAVSEQLGQIREGNGMVTVFRPDGGSRSITFEAGTPVFYDQSQADAVKDMTVTRDEGTSVVISVTNGTCCPMRSSLAAEHDPSATLPAGRHKEIK